MTLRRLLALTAGLIAFSPLALGGTPRIAPDEVPAPLRPWVDWARHDPPPAECPRTDGERPDSARCVWPGAIDLRVSARQGSFALAVEAFGEGAVQLPGDAESWPRDVRVDGQAVPVIAREGSPSVRVGAGRHSVTGRFEWKQMPTSLLLPENAASLVVAVDDAPFAGQPDASGRLWLRASPDRQGAVDSVSMRVFRQFADDVPMSATVRYEMSVSGQQREIRVPRAVLDGFVPLSVEGSLPARIEADGSMKVQARAGSWVMSVTSRRMSTTLDLRLPETATEQEVWSFAPRNEVRVVNLEGPAAVDPKSVGVPAEWVGLPTFMLQPGDALKIVEVQRGDSGGASDRLAIRRTLWLDFDGGGYSVQDRISGTIGRSWRLDLPEQFALGRVSVDGVDLPVTRSDAGRGVELRDASIMLEADSRIDSAARDIPASGWTAALNDWTTELNLPPGWRLLHASGADSVQGEWLWAWTLWDIFAVLLIAAVTFRVVGPAASAILLAALVLTWHTADAPRFLWLALVVCRAVASALPAEAKLRDWARRGAVLSGALIAIMLVAFAVTQIRQAMYPALDMSYEQAMGRRSDAAAMRAAPQAPAPVERAIDGMEDRIRQELSAPSSSADPASAPKTGYYKVDPGVRVQTGPGIPSWRWTTAELASHGPVAHDQMLSLILLSPAATALWSLLSVVLSGLALAGCWNFDRVALMRKLRGALRTGVVPALVVAFLGLAPGEGQAESFPPQALLDELRARLLAPESGAACAPLCADIAELAIEASGDVIVLRLELHAQARTAVPLPSPGANIRPSSVFMGGKPAALLRDEKGVVWTMMPTGIAIVEMRIAAHQDDIPLLLPLKPRRVVAELSRWSLAGLDAHGLPTDTLTLSRVREVQPGAAKEFAGGAELPPFAEIERHISFDQTWTVRTSVRRRGPSALQLTLRIPLLAGEAVTDPDVRVEDGEAVIDLAPGATRSFGSVLERSDKVRLVTSSHPGQIERWTISASPLWHVASSGLAPAQWTSGSAWQPRWLPWPGESIDLAITRPQVIDGDTLTIDEVQLATRIGHRASEVSASIRLRSSAGGNHVIGLPEGAELLSVRIDGQPQPLRAEKGRLALPITPGSHSVQVDWRDVSAISSHYRSPRLDLGARAVNATVTLAVPQDRVVLVTRGPLVGPAVLLWGLLVVVLGIAVVLSRVVPTPLGVASWILLGVGLVQSSVAAAFVVVAWFVLLALRRNWQTESAWRFNLFQAVLLLFALLAANALLSALRQGLLGYPEMLVTGNGSDAFNLRWYLDRVSDRTPEAEFFSIPVFAYRLMMLAWALWLAVSLTRWARWAWSCLASGGAYWRPLPMPTLRAGKRTGSRTPETEPDAARFREEV